MCQVCCGRDWNRLFQEHRKLSSISDIRYSPYVALLTIQVIFSLTGVTVHTQNYWLYHATVVVILVPNHLCWGWIFPYHATKLIVVIIVHTSRMNVNTKALANIYFLNKRKLELIMPVADWEADHWLPSSAKASPPSIQHWHYQPCPSSLDRPSAFCHAGSRWCNTV